MKHRWIRTCLALCFAGLVAASAQAADRTAKEIVDDIQGIKEPNRPDGKDQAAVLQYLQQRRANDVKQADLILELYRKYPDHEMVVKLLPTRWQTMMRSGKRDEAAKEITEATSKIKDEKLKTEGAFLLAIGGMNKLADAPDAALAAIDAFVKLAPKDERGGQLLFMALMNIKDDARKAALEDRILKDYADTDFAPRIAGMRRQREGLGKPFELEFNDAISGSPLSIKGLKGKVVVIDFWATWCGPCVAEMPKMKELYAKYKDKGVEFIGISLDQPEDKGGLKSLKEFVAKNEITWPQYYQGKYWNSPFSQSWGINGIPCVFIVDSQGNLYSTEARGQLEELIPKLLDKPAAGGN